MNITPPAISQRKLPLSTKGWFQSIAIREAVDLPPVLLCSTLNLLSTPEKIFQTY